MFKLPLITRHRPRRAPAPSNDTLEVFGSEQTTGSPSPSSTPPPRAKRRSLLVGLLALALLPALALSLAALQKWRVFQLEASTGSVTIESNPPGAEVHLAGVRQGTTPLTLSVPPGTHPLELVLGERRKALNATATAGAAVIHHVDLGPEPPAGAATGSIRIVTEPASLQVTVDGVPRGAAPLTVEALAPGPHGVEVAGPNGRIQRVVQLRAGESASVIISAAVTPVGPAAGWLTVASPVALQVMEGQQVIGTSEASRIMLPAGRHDLQFVNEALGFSERRTVQVTAGGSASVRVALPSAPLSLNAVPWAEVWVDGTRVGETPIGNHLVPIGIHEVVFRHPEFGERRQTVVVSLKTPGRVSVDMRRPRP